MAEWSNEAAPSLTVAGPRRIRTGLPCYARRGHPNKKCVISRPHGRRKYSGWCGSPKPPSAKRDVAYSQRSRTHLALGKDPPVERAVQPTGRIVMRPEVGGLHHKYERQAA